MLTLELFQNASDMAYKLNPATTTVLCFFGHFFTFSETLIAYINGKYLKIMGIF